MSVIFSTPTSYLTAVDSFQNGSGSIAVASLSAPIVSGNTRINGNLTINGEISALSGATFVNTTFVTTSALSISATLNTGPAFRVQANGSGDIASFYDTDTGTEMLHIGGENSTNPWVGIRTSTPNKELTLSGAISATGDAWFGSNIYTNNTNIDTLYAAKAPTDAAVTVVASNSATWGAGAGGVDVQVFTSNGIWSKPAGAKSVHIQCIGGGGGGGSGRASLSGTAAGGGGGGASGARSFMFLEASFLSATEAVTVGTGGNGGSGVAPGGAGQNGNVGGSGTASSFGSSTVWVYAGFGGGGGNGTFGAGGAGGAAAFRGMQAGLIGGSASSTFGAGGAGNNGTGGAPGSGGGGGGINASGTIANAGSGGFQFIINGGTANQTPVNTAGFSVPANSPFGGSGGGGGSGSTTGNASNGGAGGLYGAGGGGGGPAVGFNSGSGGNGAPGIVVVTTFF